MSRHPLRAEGHPRCCSRGVPRGSRPSPSSVSGVARPGSGRRRTVGRAGAVFRGCAAVGQEARRSEARRSGACARGLRQPRAPYPGEACADRRRDGFGPPRRCSCGPAGLPARRSSPGPRRLPAARGLRIRVPLLRLWRVVFLSRSIVCSSDPPVVYPPLLIRAVARGLDFLVLLAVNIVLVLAFAVAGALLIPGSGSLLAALVALLSPAPLTWLYFALQESGSRQATVGGRACHLRVLDQDGTRLSFARASARHAARYLTVGSFATWSPPVVPHASASDASRSPVGLHSPPRCSARPGGGDCLC